MPKDVLNHHCRESSKLIAIEDIYLENSVKSLG